jgi:hypothetical protein
MSQKPEARIDAVESFVLIFETVIKIIFYIAEFSLLRPSKGLPDVGLFQLLL